MPTGVILVYVHFFLEFKIIGIHWGWAVRLWQYPNLKGQKVFVVELEGG
jgi:hypothetical protein